MKRIIISILLSSLVFQTSSHAQTAEELIVKIKEKLDKVNDYEARGKMKMNVVFIKAPVANVKVYYKKPDKLKVNNESGISLIPKGTININMGNLVANSADCDILDAGKDPKTGFRIIKLLPRDENGDVALSTLYVDDKLFLVRKAKTTTRENGSYELEMDYGKYADYGLADKVVFTFNTKDYKLPKGVTFDYNDGSKKEVDDKDKLKNKKGKVEISYSSYLINKGLPDSVFQ